MLDALRIPYDIFESADRVGGRVYTHYFSDKTHEYYDIGAMRFPKTPFMQRTFDLFERTKVKLVEYNMSHERQPTRFNDHTVFGFDPNDPKPEHAASDPFRVGVKSGGTVLHECLRRPQSILDDAYDYFRDAIKRDPPRGFRLLLKHDRFSVRDWLGFVESQDDETIHWLETLNSATGWFSQAFTETVLDTLAFDYAPDTKWHCVDGGTSVVVEKVAALLSRKPEMKCQVVAVARDAQAPDHEQMKVSFRREGAAAVEKRSYAAVINTTTFGALQKMDLCGLQLPYSSKTAIRSLHYDTSTKVGIRFKYPWWRTELGIKTGGLGKTDLRIRVCVYPSYNGKDDEKLPAVLLASYTWGQDSERIASFVNGHSPRDEDGLKELLIYNLARLHSDDEAGFARVEATISGAWLEHHAYDWSKDAHAAGAFALFSPGQFQTLYSTLVRPASDSRFYMVGEAASCNHAWTVGALDSAVRGLHLLLTRFQQYGKRDELARLFGPTGELDYATDHLQVALGMLRQQDQPNTISGPLDLTPAVLSKTA